MVKNLLWPDEASTQAFAQRLAHQPECAHALIALHGNLGAGKTTLARYLLQACGVQGRIKSPSYAIVESYELPQGLAWHCDFYRFSNPLEWEDAGFRDLFASTGLKIVEWPEKAAGLMPTADWDVQIEMLTETARQVQITARTPLGVHLLQAL
jgi:tRNA threonylcarbamoyladenosine biosynthesis protein TsaE